MKYLSFKKTIYTFNIITVRSAIDVLKEMQTYFKDSKDFRFSSFIKPAGITFQLYEVPWMPNSFIPIFYGTVERKENDTVVISGYLEYNKEVKLFFILIQLWFLVGITLLFWMQWEWILAELGAASFIGMIQFFGAFASRSSKDVILKFLNKITKQLY